MCALGVQLFCEHVRSNFATTENYYYTFFRVKVTGDDIKV